MSTTNPVLRTEFLAALRASFQRVILLALFAAIVDVVWMMQTANMTMIWVHRIAIGVWATLAIVVAIASMRAGQRPEVKEILEHPGSIVRVTTGDRIMRVILRSGAELRMKLTLAEMNRLSVLFREHSPQADFASHAA